MQIAGCGYIGRAVATALSETGGPALRAWSRRGQWTPDPQEQLPATAPCPLHAVDLLRAPDRDLRDALKEVETLLLSYAPGRRPGASSREALYLQAPGRLLPHLPAKSRVIALSSTSALPDLNATLDESCTLAPQSPRGQVQREAENQLWALTDRHDLDLVILRLAGIYGPGRPLQRLYGRSQEGPRPGDGNIATNLIHRDDVVQAVGAALALPGPVRTLFHVCGQDHPSRRDMIAWAHAQSGQDPPAWEHPPGDGPVRGKRVSSTRLQAPLEFGGLGVRLRHPRHRPAQ